MLRTSERVPPQLRLSTFMPSRRTPEATAYDFATLEREAEVERQIDLLIPPLG